MLEDESVALIPFDLDHFQAGMRMVEEELLGDLVYAKPSAPQPIYNAAKELGHTLRDYGMRTPMSSLGPELFAGNIEVLRNILDHADGEDTQPESKPAITAFITLTLVMVAYCSLKEDVTPGLVYGNHVLTYLHRLVVNRAADIKDQVARGAYLNETDRAYKHMMVCLTSCVMSIASTRENVDPDLSHKSNKAVAAARQDFVAVTMAGQICRACAIPHRDLDFQFKEDGNPKLQGVLSTWNHESVKGWAEHGNAGRTANGYVPEKGIAPCATVISTWTPNKSVYAMYACTAGSYCYVNKEDRRSYPDFETDEDRAQYEAGAVVREETGTWGNF